MSRRDQIPPEALQALVSTEQGAEDGGVGQKDIASAPAVNINEINHIVRIFWRTGQDETANTYVIAIALEA
jgi:hypothetical protein